MRGAIYARYSTAKQNNKSIEDQIQICSNYARSEGIEVVKVYSDKETSGYLAQREGLNELLKDAEARVFDVLLVEHTSRLARDGYELRKLIHEFRFRYRIPIIFVSQNLRTDREGDIAVIKLFNIIDEQYIEGIKVATKRGLEGVFRRRKWTGGNPPFGYRVKDGQLEVVPEEAKIVREIFQQYAKGVGLKTICKQLNELGIRTRKGNPWSASSLSALMKNPIYKGEVVWGRRRYVKDGITGKVYVVKNEDYLKREEPSLRIVEPELWEECNRRLAEVPHGKPKHKKIHPLMGIVKCGVCGYNMSKEGNTLCCSSFRTRKSCSNNLTLNYDFLFRWLVGHLKKFIELNRSGLEQRVKRGLSGSVAVDYESKIESLKNKLRNLYNLYSESPDEILKEEINRVKQEIRALENAIKSSESSDIDLENILEEIETIFKKKPEETNYLLKLFFHKVEISPANGTAHVRVVFNRILPENFEIRSIAGAGFEPATSGL